MHNLRYGILVLAVGDVIGAVNRTYYAMFNARPADVVGRSILAVAEDAWGGVRLADLLDDARVSGEAAAEFDVRVAGAALRAIRCTARRMTARTGEETLVLVTEDITARRACDAAAHLQAAEISHRVKNSLQIIASSIGSEQRRVGDAADVLATIGARIAAVGMLYDVMAKAGQGVVVYADEFFEALADGLRRSLLSQRTQISIRVDAERLALTPSVAEPIGLLVNELVTNAVKHAFPERGGEISLSIRAAGERLLIEVADDGIGVATEAASGLGSRFVAGFVSQLRATISRSTSTSGSVFQIRAPLPAGMRPAIAACLAAQYQPTPIAC
jgi:two-component sensor histidine kinase